MPTMRWWERAWVGGILVVAVATAIQAAGDVWPFVAWTMFSSPGPDTSDQLVVVAVGPDDETVHRDERLPGGYVRDRYQHRFEGLDDADRRDDCGRMLAALRRERSSVEQVRIERWTWPLRARSLDVAPTFDREPVLTCG